MLWSAVSAEGRIMTLKECILTGIENNLTIANARLEITNSREGVSENRARLLPVINGVIQFTDYLKSPVNVTTGTLLGNDFPDDPTWQTIRSMQYNAGAGVQLTMPLFDRSISAAIDVAKTVERLSRLSYEQGVEELTMQIGKVYFLAQSSLEQANLTEENIGRMTELCAITEAMYDEGTVLEVDVNRVRINLRNLETQLDGLKAMYSRQVNMLRFLMDLPPEAPVDVERMTETLESAAMSGISETLPELLSAQTRKELVARNITAVKAGYLPRLSLTGYAGGLGYQEKFSHFFHTRDAGRNLFGNCFIGFNLTIPIFDANSRKFKIRRQRIMADQAENSIRQLRERLSRDYSDAMLQISHSMNVYRTQSLCYRQAKDVYEVTEEQYREGVASMTAILQDEMQLRTAQTACVEAHCRYDLARLDLLKLSGNLAILTE